MLNGYKVLLHTPAPKMQLSEDCPVTDDFRKEMNEWLTSFFGYEEDKITRGEVIVMHASHEIIMSYKTWKELYSHLSLHNDYSNSREFWKGAEVTWPKL